MLKVRLFGAGLATYHNHPLAGFPAQQCHLLLCYLLLNPYRRFGRERLAAVFWSDYPTATSRTYLRSALWRLRRVLELAGALPMAYVQADPESICFAPVEPFWSDVDAFQQSISAVQDIPGDALTQDQAIALGHATALYTGDLLDCIFEEWCLCERERLRGQYASALGKLSAYHERSGRYELGLVYGMRLLSMDATSESVHRQVMRLYWRMGNRQEALAQYNRCKQILHEEFGVAPTRETRTLHEQMVQNRWDAPEPWRNCHPPPAVQPLHEAPPLPPGALETRRSAAATPQAIDAGALAQDALAQLRHVQTVVKQSLAELLATESLIEQVLTAVGNQPPALVAQTVPPELSDTR